jgi:hypothetical protein
MKKTILLATVFVLALLTMVAAGVQTVKAQHTPDGQGFPLASPISIISPSNSTYSSNLLTLSITAKILFDPSCATISYSVDGKNNATLPIVATLVPVMGTITYANGTTTTAPAIFSPYTITGSVVLSELPEGPHRITVYAKYRVNNAIGLDNCTVFFTINDGIPPIISNLSFENKTYSQNNLPLNFTTDEPTSWMGYSLDGQANVTITGNTTLTGLSDGIHSLIVYSKDAAGNTGASETIHFTTAQQFGFLGSSLPMEIGYAIVAVIVVAIALAVFLVYFRKTRKHLGKLRK